MKSWFISLPGAITLAVISFLVFLGRAFIDFYYVFEEFGLSVGMVGGAILIHLVLFGGSRRRRVTPPRYRHLMIRYFW